MKPVNTNLASTQPCGVEVRQGTKGAGLCNLTSGMRRQDGTASNCLVAEFSSDGELRVGGEVPIGGDEAENFVYRRKPRYAALIVERPKAIGGEFAQPTPRSCEPLNAV